MSTNLTHRLLGDHLNSSGVYHSRNIQTALKRHDLYNSEILKTGKSSVSTSSLRPASAATTEARPVELPPPKFTFADKPPCLYVGNVRPVKAPAHIEALQPDLTQSRLLVPRKENAESMNSKLERLTTKGTSSPDGRRKIVADHVLPPSGHRKNMSLTQRSEGETARRFEHLISGQGGAEHDETDEFTMLQAMAESHSGSSNSRIGQRSRPATAANTARSSRSGRDRQQLDKDRPCRNFTLEVPSTQFVSVPTVSDFTWHPVNARVSCVPLNWTPADLHRELSKFGPVLRVCLPAAPPVILPHMTAAQRGKAARAGSLDSGGMAPFRSRGFAYVTFGDGETALRAKTNMLDFGRLPPQIPQTERPNGVTFERWPVGEGPPHLNARWNNRFSREENERARFAVELEMERMRVEGPLCISSREGEMEPAIVFVRLETPGAVSVGMVREALERNFGELLPPSATAESQFNGGELRCCFRDRRDAEEASRPTTFSGKAPQSPELFTKFPSCTAALCRSGRLMALSWPAVLAEGPRERNSMPSIQVDNDQGVVFMSVHSGGALFPEDGTWAGRTRTGRRLPHALTESLSKLSVASRQDLELKRATGDFKESLQTALASSTFRVSAFTARY
uniref:RRM domain-containing protein n=1 Tax=Chromera velia CCMP2878 TaxID=1169474 RepID=A0A0G4HUU1_9ALVE|eukprot:Cvel_8696.t1-p1 / transcript=Cvel_8696.t1 / gene=Cvel_8696 / organism=Chromera_velia_CCMP2878 / gene_product=hypothetical protein / transcript_product=hypothetical protein / location=Cvel_scaffold485:50354-53941(+) / protein_length=624 / sequence_SO=supercontig / SO=protein_coding / is_pseudo=false